MAAQVSRDCDVTWFRKNSRTLLFVYQVHQHRRRIVSENVPVSLQGISQDSAISHMHPLKLKNEE